MRTKLGLALTFLLIAGGLWFFYQTAAVASRGGEDTPLYSAERHDPYGTAALKDLLAERGACVSLLLRATPDEGKGSVLIEVLAHNPHDLLAAPVLQTQRLKDWIERGNTLIQFTRSETRLMKEYHLSAAAPVDSLNAIEEAEAHGKPQASIPCERQMVRWIAAPVAKGPGLLPKPVGLEFYSALVLKPAPGHDEWHPLATKAGDAWVAATRAVGKGRLIVVGTPTPVLNGALGNAGNMEFVLALTAASAGGVQSPVIFDEWSHGLGHERTIIGFIQESGLFPSLLQLFFVVALYVWATCGFSQADERVHQRRRSSSEQIDTLGHLYRQAMKPDMVFGRVYAEVRNRIALALGCTPAAIERTLERTAPEIAQEARTILDHLHTIGRGRGPACPKCGYDLTRNASGACPECGAEISWTIKNRIARGEALADVPERQKQSRKADMRLAAALRESHLFVEEFARDRNRRP